MPWGHAWQGGVHGWGSMHGRGHAWLGGMCGGGMYGTGYYEIWSVNAWAVCILLECILVLKNVVAFKFFRNTQSWQCEQFHIVLTFKIGWTPQLNFIQNPMIKVNL